METRRFDADLVGESSLAADAIVVILNDFAGFARTPGLRHFGSLAAPGLIDVVECEDD